MGLPDRDRLLCQQAWKRCRGSLEKRGWVKPAEIEEDELKKQHQDPVAPTPLQSTIPAVLKKLERAYEAPAHITANDHPDDWEPSNRDSGGSWDPTSVTSYHAVSRAHPEPSAPPNTGAFNSAPTSWLSTGSSVPGLDSATTAPQGAAYHGRGSSFHSHDKRASVISAFPLERTVILEHLSEDNNDDENDNGTNPYPMSAYVKTKMTDGNYNHAARRNAIDHGQGTGTGIWLEVSGSGGAAEGPEGPVDDSGSASPPPPEAVPKAKEIFPLLSVPSQAVSTSSLSPSPDPSAREVASVV
ncbi:hypothetical protein B0H65DRAFT_477666 [Neurospora tetraspora]|uniref:Uncharacterized protein n=1 Tax=Neurospora tetraspora TaxID=94610 RepID=A0AAE0MMZ2_9PEZI|nr:hypothetical protein B0H65DRAFT_477666 [Neurospora tetraspora]